jgi:hypothetical protein
MVSERSLQALYETAKSVLDKREGIEALRKPLESLEAMALFRDSTEGQGILKQARDLYADSACDIEVDDHTLVYHNGFDGH